MKIIKHIVHYSLYGRVHSIIPTRGLQRNSNVARTMYWAARISVV